VGLSLGHHIVEPFLKEITALGKSNVLVFSFGMAIMANQLPKGCMFEETISFQHGLSLPLIVCPPTNKK